MNEFWVAGEPLRRQVNETIERLLPSPLEPPEALHQAMRYAALGGGKRIRALLVLLTGDLYGVEREILLPSAAALELIHTFSLVHDDLPALDDDDLRRGRPTVHCVWDDAMAVLVGDALLNLAYETLARYPSQVEGEVRARVLAEMALATGTGGMIGGQAEDVLAERDWPKEPAVALERIHRRKTGALIAVGVRLGGLYAGVSPAEQKRLRDFGEALGLMFQIVDDILDVEGTSESLGKTAGKDVQAAKLTFPALLGMEESKRRLEALTQECRRRVVELPEKGGPLAELVEFLAKREH